MWLTPSTMTKPSDGVYVFDFDQNFSGWCKITVNGTRGTAIVLRLLSSLNERLIF